MNFLEDRPTFAKRSGVFRPLTVTKTSRYWLSMQSVAFGTRKVTCGIVCRRSCARAWCHLTIRWSLTRLTVYNYRKEKQSKIILFSECFRQFLLSWEFPIYRFRTKSHFRTSLYITMKFKQIYSEVTRIRNVIILCPCATFLYLAVKDQTKKKGMRANPATTSSRLTTFWDSGDSCICVFWKHVAKVLPILVASLTLAVRFFTRPGAICLTDPHSRAVNPAVATGAI